MNRATKRAEGRRPRSRAEALDVLVGLHEGARRAAVALNAAAGVELRAMRAQDELQRLASADPEMQRRREEYDGAILGIAGKRGTARQRAETKKAAAWDAVVAYAERQRAQLAASHPDLWREATTAAEEAARALDQAQTAFEQACAVVERARSEMLLAGDDLPYIVEVYNEANRRRAVALAA
jgi:hypothetical protein